MTNPVEMDLFEKSGYYQIKNCVVTSEDKKSVTFTADITGNIPYLEELLQGEIGKKVTLINRNSSL